MAVPWGEIAGAVATVGSTAANISSTGKLNRKNRQWQEEMWQRTNEYNLPTAQMERLRAAGLNPHLMYGQGTVGNTTAPTPPQQQYPDYSGFGEAAMNYISVRKQQTEVDNMKKAQEVMEADKVYKDAQTAYTLSNTAKTKQETAQAAELFDITLQQANANVQSTNTQTAKTLKEIDQIVENTKTTQIQQQAIKQSISESVARIQNLKADNDLKAIQKEIESLKRDMYKNGINPNSSPMWTVPAMILQNSGITPAIQKGLKDFKGGLNWMREHTPTFKQWIRD